MEQVSLIITVKNEARTLQRLLRSIERQSRRPNEVIIVDGGSTDATFEQLQQWAPSFPVKIMQKKGNRSVGRNAAIVSAAHPVIAITDAGCVLDTDWLKEILTPFNAGAEVVAGYYRPDAHTPFAKAVAAYMLVMPDLVDEANFLPATRSMAMLKDVWKLAGMFDERYAYNEDYVFARRLQMIGIQIVFARKAIVLWQPPASLPLFIRQIYKFAYGDAESGTFRPKVAFIYARYTLLGLLALASPVLTVITCVVYLFWSVQKNYRHVESPTAAYILPFLQISTDITVMIGTGVGLTKKVFYAKAD